MFRKLSLAAATLAMGASALIPATPAAAQRYERYYQDQRYGDYDRDYYYDRGYYQQDRGYRGYRDYRDHRRDYRSRRCNNDAGTIIGAIAGGLLGNGIAGRGDRTLGTVLGAGAGALAGRAIDRSDDPGYCRR
ncbi:glycine zipper 2TM domain-containing protein [Sphingomonas oligophenolica]|uniref:17 kDa surface antigen n=1 Tax=Sphingomonas oligophenolica TaxID=301154 RepID=A0ABU9Y4T2_9SPHN